MGSSGLTRGLVFWKGRSNRLVGAFQVKVLILSDFPL
jgi:hypothetical protein